MSAQDQVFRGDLLQFLNNIYPSKAAETSIIAAYFQYQRPAVIQKALNYLSDSGYIEKIERKHPFRPLEKVFFYKIEPKGINLLEHAITDAGVTVIDERTL
ncbi:hypothetical protein [Parasphaerochaeta coccoides]|uniref:Uncharacterized protein n=1 Tax=Parasphaerochaeta coccoides (strain ATCC BAA-1237 / DSM 17374 / SPN1) TaxID=760011 RepID=F4GHE5_PARC1|nr:hypothetical protein [Parasphaerochaeta coccoides]AEC02044.1 hypothetical protein Spico_0820 [Parasphaerochaeta coccoides DSM 17374]